MKTKFGLPQLFKTTPKWVVITYYILTAVISVALLQLANDPFLTQKSKDIIEYYLLYLQVLISALAPFFGLNPVTPKK